MILSHIVTHGIAQHIGTQPHTQTNRGIPFDRIVSACVVVCCSMLQRVAAWIDSLEGKTSIDSHFHTHTHSHSYSHSITDSQ